MLMFRVSKIEKWEALFLDRTEHPSVPAQTSEILVLTIGMTMRVTGESVVCGINLF